jgi:hypothetical protein
MNKILIALALIADIALVINVVHHWERKPVLIGIECHTTKTTTLNCAIKEEQ